MNESSSHQISVMNPLKAHQDITNVVRAESESTFSVSLPIRVAHNDSVQNDFDFFLVERYNYARSPTLSLVLT